MKKITVENCLASKHPEIAREWHPTKNKDLSPDDVLPASNKKVWWMCERGHEWEAVINNRVRSQTGCPYCSNHRVLPGFNDLATVYSDVAKEWHPTKNGSLKPTDVVFGSDKVVWWHCPLGHEWQTKINRRTKEEDGCPFCSGHRLLQGFNDLAFKRPDIASQWHPTKNGDLKPTDVQCGTNKVVWWMCTEGHEWTASINVRTQHNTTCPYCSDRAVDSGRNDLETRYPDLAAEWHSARNGGRKPSEILFNSTEVFWWLGSCGHEWKATISNRLEHCDCPFCSGRKLLSGFNDLETKRPDLAAEWHPTKNGNLKPSDYTVASNKKVWWLGPCGHEWETKILLRTRGSNCPYCASVKLLPGFNDLETRRPDIAAEWHPAKNGNLRPSDVMLNHDKHVWWLGPCGHEWSASPSNRNQYNTGCPICASSLKTSFGEKAIAYYLSKVTYVEESSTIPGTRLEMDVYVPSMKLGIEYDGPFHAKYIDRDIRKNQICADKGIELIRFRDVNCPEISGKYYIVDDRDKSSLDKPIRDFISEKFGVDLDVNTERDSVDILAKKQMALAEKSVGQCPELLNSWDFEKNEGINPAFVSYGSGSKYWWKCDLGHSWRATVANRYSSIGKMDRACPYCNNRMVLRGFNDLVTKDSKLAAEWHPTKNGNLKPEDVSIGAGQVWWLGTCGHEWQMRVNDRYFGGQDCPFCSGKRVLKGFNDLVTKDSKLAAEWHPTKNGNLKPDEFTIGSSKKVWWLGACGHEWYVSIADRAHYKTGCPFCSNRKVLRGFNDLATKKPELIAEWHPTKNGNLKPDEFTIGSDKKVWWLGPCGHEWEASIKSRAIKGSGCKICYFNRAKTKHQ